MPADEVDRGVESLPRPLPYPPLHRGRRLAAVDGPVQSDHAGLATDEMVE
jgi:hypothetical protein